MSAFSYKLSVFLFVLVTAIFFQQTFRFGKLPVPTDTLIGLYHPWRDSVLKEYPRGMPYKNFLITDPIRQQIPWRKEAIERIKKGELPLLSTNNGLGVPLLGNIQAGTLYPFNLIFFVLPFETAWTVLIITQVLFAGLFFLLYASHLNLHPLAALIGAVAWSFSGFSIAWLTWGTIVHTALWLPLLLFAIDTWREERSLISLLLFAVGLSCSFLAGHAQVFLYVLILTFFYILFRFFKPANETSEQSGWGYLSGLSISVVVFLGLTFIQWFPLYHALQQSTRIGEELLFAKEGWFIPFQHLLQLFAPDFFGNPATLNYWGTWNYGEMVSYIGIIPLLFIIPALLFSFRKHAFWIAIVVVAFLFMTPTSVSTLPYELNLPLLSSLQPTRITVLFQFALIMLSVLGVDYVVKSKLSVSQILGTIVVSILPAALLWLLYLGSNQQIISFIPQDYLEITRRNILLPSILSGVSVFFFILLQVKRIGLFTGIFLFAVVAFELLRFGWKFTPFTDQAYFFPETETIGFLQTQPNNTRMMAIDNKLFPPNSAAYYNLPFVSHYDPLSSERYETFVAAMERGNADLSKPYGFNRIVTPQNIASPLFPHLSVEYLISLAPLDSLPLIHQEGETKVYQMKNTLPLVYLVSDVTSSKDIQESINTLYRQDFRVGTQAIIESEPVEFDPSVTGRLNVIEHSPEYIKAEVTSGGKMLIVVNRLYDPWWRVTINGQRSNIQVTNGAFMGVILPEGTHLVEFSYGLRF